MIENTKEAYLELIAKEGEDFFYDVNVRISVEHLEELKAFCKKKTCMVLDHQPIGPLPIEEVNEIFATDWYGDAADGEVQS